MTAHEAQNNQNIEGYKRKDSDLSYFSELFQGEHH